MKRLILVLFFPTLFQAQPNSKKIRVLFLGNSYTYVNNLPQMIQSVAHAQGDSLLFDSNLPGGYTFSNHFYDLTSLSKISLGNWDYVILQAQSQEPAFSPLQVNSQTLPFAIQLDSLIRFYNPCATTVFYETWGRKFGDPSNCAAYPPICTYLGMQNRLRESYKLFADTTHAIIAPVGEAFRKVIATNTTINLYQPDDSHPSLEGTFLAAAVFYETLFQKSVLTSTYNPGLTLSNASLLNQLAHQTVSDSLNVWNISTYVPKAQFSYSAQSSSNFQFQTETSSFLTKWFFGDGTTSIAQNPSHSYSVTGIYTVSLLVYDFTSCKKDSATQVVSAISTTGVQDLTSIFKPIFFPNPCKTSLYLEVNGLMYNEKSTIQIHDSFGRLCLELPLAFEIDVSQLKNGIYFISIGQNDTRVYKKFVKQN